MFNFPPFSAISKLTFQSSFMELAAMSFACRELGNRKRQKTGNLGNYMKDVDSKLQALTEAVARLEQVA